MELLHNMSDDIKYAFGFDPSINDSAFAIVGTDGSVRCGLIRNDSEDSNPWKKCGRMIDLVQNTLSELELPKFEVLVCEAQYTTFGKGSQDSSVRLGWISSACYCSEKIASKTRTIAVPSQWTCGKPKEYRHPIVLKRLKSMDTWEWVGKPAPTGLMHNIIDAVSLARWGLDLIG